MAISIKDAETDRLARELSQATGESLTETIRRALQERLERETRSAAQHNLSVLVRRIQERVAKLPVLDARAADEIVGYDQFGLPR